VRGAPEELAILGHGSLEVVPANICVQAVGMEVRWWCAPPLFLSRVVRIRRSCGSRAGWLALYVLAVLWRHCWRVPSHLSDSGGAEVVDVCLLLLG
jgi:hypothetical protein